MVLRRKSIRIEITVHHFRDNNLQKHVWAKNKKLVLAHIKKHNIQMNVALSISKIYFKRFIKVNGTRILLTTDNNKILGIKGPWIIPSKKKDI